MQSTAKLWPSPWAVLSVSTPKGSVVTGTGGAVQDRRVAGKPAGTSSATALGEAADWARSPSAVLPILSLPRTRVHLPHLIRV